VEDDASEGLLTPDLGGEWERLEKRYRPSSRIFRPNTLQYCNLCIAQSRCFHLIIENHSTNPHSQYAAIEKDAEVLRTMATPVCPLPDAAASSSLALQTSCREKECRVLRHSQVRRMFTVDWKTAFPIYLIP
jgi:hypothetical protein